jgi:hypothetical protein
MSVNERDFAWCPQAHLETALMQTVSSNDDAKLAARGTSVTAP